MKDKNILYFTRTMGLGGTENVILELCESMKGNFANIIVCSCGGVNVSRLESLGIKHYSVPDIEKKDIKTIITVFKTLISIVKNEKINIIHTHHRMAAFYISLLNFYNKFIFVNTVHNTFTDKRILTKFSLGKANNIAVGNSVRTNLINFYRLPEKKVTVIYNAVKPFKGNRFNEISIIKKYREKGYYLIGNIGRISKQKGMEFFIRSIPDVLKVNKNVKFFIVGTGEDEDKIRDIISDLGLENDVILLGYRDDVQNTMMQLDLIVLSSLWEGFPLTPIEAFSVKKTIIATEIDGTSEIVLNNYNGILVPKESCEGISKAITSIMRDDKIKEELEYNAYKTYLDKFSYDIFIKRYRVFYEQTLRGE